MRENECFLLLAALLSSSALVWGTKQGHHHGLLPTDVECGPHEKKTGPISGNLAEVMEVPWVARLGYRRGAGAGTAFECGGALISRRYVLTAARCTQPNPPVTVRLGEHDLTSDLDCNCIGGGDICAPPVVDVDVEEAVAHPEYVSGGRRNDIALVRLARPVALTDAVAPVCLPAHLPAGQDPEDALPRRRRAYRLELTGWGRIGKGGSDSEQNILFKLELRTTNHSECAAKYSELPDRIDEARQMCGIGRDGRDVCSGDTGGPLTGAMPLAEHRVRAVLWGVVSFGPAECTASGVPAVFTRVTYYMPWIMSQLRPCLCERDAMRGYEHLSLWLLLGAAAAVGVVEVQAGSEPTEFQCEGALISARYVVTAAYCVKDWRGNTVNVVRLGEHDEATDPDCEKFGDDIRYCAPPVIEVGVEEAIQHPEYSANDKWNDIGLLRLKEAVAFSESVQPVSVPRRLRKIELKEMPHDDCVATFSKISTTIQLKQALQLCVVSNKPGQNFCEGFGGGPFTIVTRRYDGDIEKRRSVLEGIVGFGTFCEGKDVVTVFTRVAHYVPWILDNMRLILRCAAV
ncbi:Serine Protease [Frankliniella occidentalis]|nr:Serine Protease [Frankliniella occidentalis]